MNPKEAYAAKPWLKHYPESVSDKVDTTPISVPDLLDRMFRKFAKKTALIFYGKKISYAELKELIDRFATALADLGVKKGDTVALYLLNCPQYVIAYYASLEIGAKVTPVSPVYTSHEIKHQLEDSDAMTIVCQDILYDNVEKTGIALKNVILTSIADYLPTLKKMLGKGALGKIYSEMKVPTPQHREQAGLLQFQDLIKKYPPKPPKVTIDPVKDIAALPYTGGTTGLPKAAMLTHANMTGLHAQVKEFWPFFEEGNELVMAFLPFFHIYGQVVVMLGSLSQGFTMVLFTTPDIDDILSAMERYQASAFYGVPTMFEYLKEYEKTDRVNWKRLKLIACGADTLHESTIDAWERRTGTKIFEGYGMTETTAISHGSPIHRPKKGSFGVPLPGMKAAIIQHDGTDFMPVGEVGELILNGPNRMAWVKITDASGSCEVTLFAEVLSRARDVLASGSNVLITAELRHDGDALRITAQDVTALDQAAAEAGAAMRIWLRETAAVPHIRELLGREGRGKGRVILVPRLDSTQSVEIALPGGFNVTPRLAQAMKIIRWRMPLHAGYVPRES